MNKKILAGCLSVLVLLCQARAEWLANWGQGEIGADWLYWLDFQDNMEYAAQVNSLSDETVDSAPINPSFDIKSGYRIFASYTPLESPWTIGGQFAHWKTQSSKETIFDPLLIDTEFIVINTNTFPIFTILNDAGVNFSSLASQWNSELNFADLDFVYSFMPRLGWVIAPHFGLRGAHLEQIFNLQGSSPFFGGVSFSSHFIQKYTGFGIEGGINASFEIGYGFSVIGALNSALLYTGIDVTETVSFSATLPAIRTAENTRHLSPWFDGLLGLNYAGCLAGFLFSLHAGWELHTIVNANHMSLFDYSSYTLQGLTLGGSISF